MRGRGEGGRGGALSGFWRTAMCHTLITRGMLEAVRRLLVEPVAGSHGSGAQEGRTAAMLLGIFSNGLVPFRVTSSQCFAHPWCWRRVRESFDGSSHQKPRSLGWVQLERRPRDTGEGRWQWRQLRLLEYGGGRALLKFLSRCLFGVKTLRRSGSKPPHVDACYVTEGRVRLLVTPLVGGCSARSCL